jgi:hypothetical protein
MKGYFAAECRQPNIICYGCAQKGHMKMNCPNKHNNPGQPGGRNKPGNGSQNNRGGNFKGHSARSEGKPYGS